MEPMPLSRIAEFLGGTLVGSADPLISGVAGIEEAGFGDLTFVNDRNLLGLLQKSGATAVLIGPGMETELPAIRLAKPYEGFARFLERFEAPRDRVFPPGIHPTAVVDETADVSAAASVGPWCVIGAGTVLGRGCRLAAHVSLGPDVLVGDDCLLHAGVSVREGCRLGQRVILHAGVRIGSDGFGFLPTDRGLQKIPQVGIVVLEDDVEIGSGSCVDRATTGTTVIGHGTKLDNLVQVGHNVKIGSHCVISGHCGIGGSCVIGDGVAMGGLVGVADHLKIGDGARIGGKSGIVKDVPAGQSVFGTPALEFSEYFRLVGAWRRLPELIRRVRKLEDSSSDSGD